MQRIRPDVDIVLDILKLVQVAQPESTFVNSLLFQYQERGGLSKKQLQGLFSKAQKINTIPAGKLATLEAIILKKHTKEKSPLPPITPLYTKDPEVGNMIDTILAKYPEHKRVLFFKMKFEKDEIFSGAELTELNKFYKLLK